MEEAICYRVSLPGATGTHGPAQRGRETGRDSLLECRARRAKSEMNLIWESSQLLPALTLQPSYTWVLECGSLCRAARD